VQVATESELEALRALVDHGRRPCRVEETARRQVDFFHLRNNRRFAIAHPQFNCLISSRRGCAPNKANPGFQSYLPGTKFDWSVVDRGKTQKLGFPVTGDPRNSIIEVIPFVGHATGSPCISTSCISTPQASGNGSRPVQFAHPQKMAVDELSKPATTPMVRGL